MGWYIVTKTINGRPYIYRQRTQRTGKRVQSHSVYLGPGSTRGGGTKIAIQDQDPEQPQAVALKQGQRRIVFHGAREGIEGPIQASEGGRYGPGLYLSNRETAELFASYAPKMARYVQEDLNSLEPEYYGSLHGFDISAARLLTFTDAMKFYDFTDRLRESEKIDDRNQPVVFAWLPELLSEQGIDGFEIEQEQEIVILAAALPKIKPVQHWQALVDE